MLRKIASLFFVILLLACRKEGDSKRYDDTGTPAYGDTMITSSIGEASNLIPLLASDGASHEVSGYVFNGLVKYDKNLRLWATWPNHGTISPDKLSITFHLRKNVRWHDGQPCTAQDVLYTYKVTIDPKPHPLSGRLPAGEEGGEVIDDYTFQVTYDKPFAPALISWAASILPAPPLEGHDITTSPLVRHPSARVPTGSRNGLAGTGSSWWPTTTTSKDGRTWTGTSPE